MLSLPYSQRWLAGKVSVFLSDYFETEVSIERLQLSLFAHAIADDFVVLDQKHRPLLSATRVGAEFNLQRFLMSGDVVINSAQFYGANAHAVQDCQDSTFNFQFIVDRLINKDSKEKKKKPYIEVRSIMVRHTNITCDRLWKEEKTGFDVNHLAVADLSLTGKLNVFDNDTVSVTLRRLSFAEKSGLSVTEGSGDFTMGPVSGYNVRDIHLSLPGSEVDVPNASYNDGRGEFAVSTSLAPADFQAFYAPLKGLNSTVYFNCRGDYDNESVRVRNLNIDDSSGSVSLAMDGELSINELLAKHFKLSPDIRNLRSIPDFNLNINKLTLSSEIENVVNTLLNKKVKLLGQLGVSSMTGSVEHEQDRVKATVDVNSPLGNVNLDGTIINGRLKAQTRLEDLQLGTIVSQSVDSVPYLKSITATLNADGIIFGSDNLPEGKLNVVIDEIGLNGYDYHGIDIDLNRHGSMIAADLKSSDPSAFGSVSAHVNTSRQNPTIQGLIDFSRLNLQKMNIVGSKSNVTWIDTRIGIDLSGGTLDNMQGNISIPHIILGNDSVHHTFTSLQLSSQPNGDERNVSLTSPYFNASANGVFKFKDLVANVQKIGHNLLPSIISETHGHVDRADLRVGLDIVDLSPLCSLLGVDLHLDGGPLRANALLSSADSLLDVNVNVPALRSGKQTYSGLAFSLHNDGDNFKTNFHGESMIKGVPVRLDLQASMTDKQIFSDIRWATDHSMRNDGEIQLSGTVEKRTKDGLVIYANVRPTEIYLNDTLWNMHPSQLYYRNNELYVDNFELSMLDGQRSVSINGTASKSSDDTLTVNLRQMDLGYILSMANLRPISLGGLVTGKLTGHSLFSKPVASGHVNIPYFLFNEAHMGALDAYLSWNVIPGSLGIEGHIVDPAFDSDLLVNGDIHLIKDPVQFINLDINCKKANAAFMQRYVSSIMDDFEGRVTGTARIFGTFREIDLEGDVLVDEAALTIPVLNTRYRAYNERVQIRPGVICLNGVRAYDKFGGPEKNGTEHSAVVSGQLTHQHFNDLRFNIDVTGENVLAYDTHSFDDGAFYATCLGSGKVHLEGVPGNTIINIDATPLRGTSLTYNAESPDALTQAGFLTFVDRSKMYLEQDKPELMPVEVPTSDMYINFNVNLTPDAQLRLLMDAKTGDYITLYGSGQMGAKYYNKGDFQIFGTARIDHGTYKLTLQDVIHKEFQLRQGGTISFNGAPMQADLNLQAVYTVPSVSLNDLSMRGTFSNNNVRVNCLMNIDGKAAAPHLTFDFELPSVNEEEARMVRSLISTEEERNLQVVYLLGIGRFFANDYTSVQDQSSTAMNSLLSTTISGQINQVMSNIIGSSDWNFGANVATGNNGWDDVDVEGMLSGRMLNNRLIFNGNFGYRDNPVAQSNFVGDFDLQWLLTKNGNLVLKAYSETNDRYFTKSSLTTQGVGIMAKKDFSSFRDFRSLNGLRKRKIRKPQQ